MFNTDGNLAALRTYEREQDALQAADDYRQRLRQDLADDLFDKYVEGDEDIIMEVDERLLEMDEEMFFKLRRAMMKECRKPVSDRGSDIYEAYWKLIDAACLEMVDSVEDDDDAYRMRNEYGI